MSLLLPAVQQARASARRIECLNRLKQIGLAVQEFELQNGVLPTGKNSGSHVQRPESTWLVSLLPFLEQVALYQKIEGDFLLQRSPYVSPPHTGLKTSIGQFQCPDDSRVDFPKSVSSLGGSEVALTSFLGVSGLTFHDSKGVLCYKKSVALSEITDGTSNTLLSGERPPSPDFNLGWWYTGEGQDGSGNADMIMGVKEQAAEPTSRLTAAGCPNVSGYSPGRLDRFCDSLVCCLETKSSRNTPPFSTPALNTTFDSSSGPIGQCI